MSFVYEKPTLLPEALALLTANSGNYPILAGGTDLIVQWRSGMIDPPGLIDISALSELRTVSHEEFEVEIGTLATHGKIALDPVIRRHFPGLAEACATVGATQIQQRGTIGGNVMNNGLIPNLPANAVVEVPCLVNRNGIQGTFAGALPEQLAGLNRTNINVQLLTIEAALTGRKEAIYNAAMLDPHTSAELPLDSIRALCDDLIKAHGKMLPKLS